MDNAQCDQTQARLAQLEEEVATLRAARERRQPLRAVSPLVGAALLAALALLLVSAVSAAPLPNTGRTFTVFTTTREVRIVDLPPAGPSQGDLRVFNAPLFDTQGKQVGRTDGFYIVTDPADEPSEPTHMLEGLSTYSLPNGTITAQGVSLFAALSALPTGTRAITGGTGSYRGAGGDVQIVPQGNRLRITFHLTP